MEGSPGVETDEPVSRQWEKDYYDYHVWPYYWGGMGVSAYPGVLVAPAVGDADTPQQEAASDQGDIHLRSTKEVTGYGIVAEGGLLGHIEDFIVDDESWGVRYLAVDTRDFWPGKKFLLPSTEVGPLNCLDRSVALGGTCDQVRNSPEWDPREPISRAFEGEVSRYYAGHRAGSLRPLAGKR